MSNETKTITTFTLDEVTADLAKAREAIREATMQLVTGWLPVDIADVEFEQIETLNALGVAHVKVSCSIDQLEVAPEVAELRSA